RHLAPARALRRAEAARRAQHQHAGLRLRAAGHGGDPQARRRGGGAWPYQRREPERPVAAGWLGSGAYETANTLELLKEAGYRYVMDWPMDDQPVWLKTRAGPILSVPYPIELNDSQVVIHRKQDAADFCEMIVD